MNTPWFTSTDETARTILRASEEDFKDFLSTFASKSPVEPAGAWYAPALIRIADLLISGGVRIKQLATPHPRTSFQTR